jgi:hypothetical protein
MVHFEVDPDSLIAAGEVADRQLDHVAKAAGYIGDVCSRTEAFSGVLQLFLGSYQETLEHANKGMRDSQAVAGKVRDAFKACSQQYVASDRSVYRTFDKIFGDEMALPPYVAPGGGDTTPAGPTSAPGAPGTKDDDDPFKLPKAPPWLNDPAGRVMPGPKPDDLPPWLDPRAAAKDHILLSMHTKADYDEYMALRAQGYSAQDAQDMVRPDVDTIADTHVHDQMETRRQDAYDNAYDQAILEGKDPDEARQLASDASSEQHHGDAVDHQNRQDILDAGGTYKGLYDQGSALVDNTQSIIDHAEQLDETTDDLGEYDDYENQDDDRSAQNWATK